MVSPRNPGSMTRMRRACFVREKKVEASGVPFNGASDAIVSSLAIKLRVQRGVVVHLELAVKFEMTRAALQFHKELCETILQVARLLFEDF